MAHPTKPVVYVGSHDYNVYAVHAETGTELWRFATYGVIHASLRPGVNARTIYAGSQDAMLYAIDAETGGLQWKFALRRSVRSSPAFSADDGGLLYAAADKLYALRTHDGSLAWTFSPKVGPGRCKRPGGAQGRGYTECWGGGCVYRGI